MTDTSRVLRLGALAALVVGVLLSLGSWDGLYDALELPQALPALPAQMGGLAFVALAYVLWASAATPELAGVAARGGALALGGSAAIITGWLVFRDRQDLGIDTAGVVVLVVVAAILAVVAAALARASVVAGR